MQWEAFVTWYKSDYGEYEGLVVNEDAVVEKAEVCRHAITAKDDVRPHMEELQKETLELLSLFDVFKSESKANSKMFALWEEYSHMIKLLFQFVKAERSGNWDMHLLCVSAMIPYFYASMDRPNYARWLPVYLMDMRQPVTKHPDVHHEFMNDNHALSRPSNPFAQVWTYMALEQSINADSSKVERMDS